MTDNKPKTDSNAALFNQLLGDCKSVDEALDKAGRDIKAIAANGAVPRGPTIRIGGYSATPIYRPAPPPARKPD